MDFEPPLRRKVGEGETIVRVVKGLFMADKGEGVEGLKFKGYYYTSFILS